MQDSEKSVRSLYPGASSPLALRQSIPTVLAALACIVGISLLQVPQLKTLRGQSNSSLEAVQREVEAERVNLNLLKQVPSFGFGNLLTDWTYLKFAQYFGDDEARDKTGYRLSPEYFEIILKHNPYFLDAYLALSTSTSIYAGMPERSISLMSQGLKSLSPQMPPKSYYVWRYKGTDELLFLGDGKAAKQSFEKAAEWASIHSDTEAQVATTLSRSTAAYLVRNPRSKAAQVSAWGMVLTYATDDYTRKLALERIKALQGGFKQNAQGQWQIIVPEN